MNIKPEIIEKINADKKLFVAVMAAIGFKDSRSLYNKLKTNHPVLTQAEAIKAIMNYTGLNQNEILED